MIRSGTSRLLTAALVVGVLTALVPATPAVATAGAGPSPRFGMAMAYDAARGQVVLFGGFAGGPHGGTWTWDGADWTKRFPAHRPPARMYHTMVYDAARSQVVLFGGHNGTSGTSDTWTWDGTDWTKPSPVHTPPARYFAAMAYDAARSEVVLFGGGGTGYLRDTWTWDGADWTKRSPAHSPPGRLQMAMAYDAGRSQVILFGGRNDAHLDDTWTWDGTDWTKRSPAHSPQAQIDFAMAYDDARGEVVLFGGCCDTATWTWDGEDWTRPSPVHKPSPRSNPGMAYDAARNQVVLFGGYGLKVAGAVADTWTWDGTDWTARTGSIFLNIGEGRPGTLVTVYASGFASGERVRLTFIDSTLGRIILDRVRARATGWFIDQVTIPAGATQGLQHVRAKGVSSREFSRAKFTVK